MRSSSANRRVRRKPRSNERREPTQLLARRSELSSMIRSLILSLLFLCMQEALATPRRTPTPASPFGTSTRLRAGEVSFITGSSRGQLDVRNVSVEVTNAGQIVAHHVQVSVVFPGGVRLVLKGLKSISQRGRALYSSASRVPVSRVGRPEVRMTCAECRG
jgi:hypothetical protein